MLRQDRHKRKRFRSLGATGDWVGAGVRDDLGAARRVSSAPKPTLGGGGGGWAISRRSDSKRGRTPRRPPLPGRRYPIRCLTHSSSIASVESASWADLSERITT